MASSRRAVERNIELLQWGRAFGRVTLQSARRLAAKQAEATPHIMKGEAVRRNVRHPPAGGSAMVKLSGFVGSIVGSYAFWYLGAPIGMFTGLMFSIVGGGVGLYYGRKFGKRYE
jgi:hypothetical protein